MNKNIIYENDIKHYLNRVTWYTTLTITEDMCEYLYNFPFTVRFLKGVNTCYNAWQPRYILTWDDYSDEQKYKELCSNILHEIEKIFIKYGSINDTPEEEIDLFLKENKIVTPEEFYMYYDRAVVVCAPYNGVQFSETTIRTINSCIFQDVYYGYGFKLSDGISMTVMSLFLKAIKPKKFNNKLNFDIWKDKATGLYTENGVLKMSFQDLKSGGYISGPYSYDYHYLDDSKLSNLSGVLVLSQNEIGPISNPPMYDVNLQYKNYNEAIVEINNALNIIPAKNGITGLVINLNNGYGAPASFAFTNYPNCKFLYVRGYGNSSCIILGAPNLKQIKIDGASVGYNMQYSFLPSNNVSVIDDSTVDYSQISSGVGNMIDYLKYTKYVQENGYSGLQIENYIS